jgi:orotidine-5'-phosphate decarboxylase
MGFLQKLDQAVDKNNSLLCIGLDPDAPKLPPIVQSSSNAYFDFNKAIIDATAALACAFKPNSAFYEAQGAAGVEQLKQTCTYIQKHYPDIPIILDYKRGDIGNSNKHYADFAFEYLGVDAITIQPYQGREAIQPFLDYKDKGIIVLCRTSNKGASEFQDLQVGSRELYLQVAENVAKDWNTNGNCLLVVGATYPTEMANIRELVGDDLVFLVPGLGTQGGDMEVVLKAGLNPSRKGLIIHASRAIIYASNGEDFAEAARSAAGKLRDEINTYRS